jgi:hypothetical protein
MQHEININGDMYTVEVTYFAGGRPAKTWGIPEDCYPEEPAEIEFDVLAVDVEDEYGNITTLEGEAAKEYAQKVIDDLECKVMEEHTEYLRDQAEDYYS